MVHRWVGSLAENHSFRITFTLQGHGARRIADSALAVRLRQRTHRTHHVSQTAVLGAYGETPVPRRWKHQNLADDATRQQTGAPPPNAITTTIQCSATSAALATSPPRHP